VLHSFPDMETQYISASDASEYTGLSQRRINQLAADGTIPSIRIGNANAIVKGVALKRLKAQIASKKSRKDNQNGRNTRRSK
jgi:excisionase family DNA binding protein